ncbi:MAG: recombinase family protein, partial [Pseudomonadota bacterium]|nr:recombinase family protein [Pseudomonadota bacterium]
GEVIRGMLEVNEDEAAIVRRIFDEIASGMSAYAIVKRLNAEGVPSPSGKKWRVSSINGDRVRANGILRNNIYRGVMVYERTHKVYHHKTRRRLIRSNPLSQWRSIDVPHLRIVTDAQWNAVQERFAQFDGVIASKQRRPKRLLSGLGRCGVCGGKWIVYSKNKWGCADWKTRGGCTNSRSISMLEYERRVLGQLQAILLNTEATALFLERYNESLRRRLAEAATMRLPLERKVEDARQKVRRLIDAVADGGNEFPEIRDRLRQAKADLADAERQLTGLSAATPIQAPVDLGERYRAFVTELDAALATDGPAREKAAAAIRALIDVIVLRPKADGRGVDVEVKGRMAEIINLARQDNLVL